MSLSPSVPSWRSILMWPPSRCDETTVWGKNKILLTLPLLGNPNQQWRDCWQSHWNISNLVWHPSYRIQLTCTDCHILCIAIWYVMPCVVSYTMTLFRGNILFYWFNSICCFEIKRLRPKTNWKRCPTRCFTCTYILIDVSNLLIALFSLTITCLAYSVIYFTFWFICFNHLQLSCENDLEIFSK